MPKGIEQCVGGYRARLFVRSPVVPSVAEAQAARDELIRATKRVRLQQRIEKLEREHQAVRA